MLHPTVAAIDCVDCAQWIFNLQTGQRETVRIGPQRIPVPQRRPAGIPTPCASCPKLSPQQAELWRLSRKNEQTYHLWQRAQATFGRAIPDHLEQDTLLARNFAELDQLHAAIDSARHHPRIVPIAR